MSKKVDKLNVARKCATQRVRENVPEVKRTFSPSNLKGSMKRDSFSALCVLSHLAQGSKAISTRDIYVALNAEHKLAQHNSQTVLHNALYSVSCETSVFLTLPEGSSVAFVRVNPDRPDKKAQISRTSGFYSPAHGVRVNAPADNDLREAIAHLRSRMGWE